MAESHVVTGLAATRSEVSGLIGPQLQVIERIGSDLRDIDAAIKTFSPGRRRWIRARYAPFHLSSWCIYHPSPALLSGI